MIFEFKGQDILVTKVQNVFKKKTFAEGQIVKLNYDDSRNKNDKENLILIDKKISNFINEGDIIEFSDSTLVLKIISVERNKKNKIQKYTNLLNASSVNDYKEIEEQLEVKKRKTIIKENEVNNRMSKSFSELNKPKKK